MNLLKNCQCLQKRKKEKHQIQTVMIGGVGKGEGPPQRTMEDSKTGREGKSFLNEGCKDWQRRLIRKINLAIFPQEMG